MLDNLARVENEQTSKLQEIGSNLRQLRQDHSLSVEEIADRTRIQPRLIRALEDGQLEILPEPVYIQGMVKKYGESLGVNGLELAKTLPSNQTTIVLAKDSRWEGFRRPQIRPLHLYVAYVLLLLSSVSALSHVLNTSVRSLQALPDVRQQLQPPAPTTSDVPAAAKKTPANLSPLPKSQI